MISIIVPAHNEQARISRTLEAIHESARAAGLAYEIIVVNDASTDATPDIARQHGAFVLSVNHRQIAATRNSGGRAARGSRLFFVDADTTINPEALAAALGQMDKGAVGGGAPVRFDGELPLYGHLVNLIAGLLIKLAGFPGGAFMFCTREAFLASGGFNERLFWAEETVWAMALKRQGRFVVLWPRVTTSGRRMRAIFRDMSLLQAPLFFVRLFASPSKVLTRRSSVEKIWYDSNRHDDDKMPNSLGARISHFIVLAFFLMLVTAPIWDFIPWSWTPLATPSGKIRFAVVGLLCHFALGLWPCAVILFVILMRQKPGLDSIRLVLLITFCAWQAWQCTAGVISVWTHLLSGHGQPASLAGRFIVF
jgi:glycosyltransferase involved in cell wall biosynthesis